MEMMNQDNTLHEQFAEVTEQVRLAKDNLEAARFAYVESPTNRNRQRIESARREYLIAVEDRESLAEQIAEGEAFEDDAW
jgi:hypothetical protein